MRTFVTEQGIAYTSANDPAARILTIYRPIGAVNHLRPAVILVHGGAWAIGNRRLKHWYGCALAQKGYVAAAIEYRKMPMHPFPACLHDAKAAVRWMRLHAVEYGVDPERIAALGDSAGAHLALLLAATRPEDGLEGEDNPGPASHISAAVSLYGPTDLRYYLAPQSWIRIGGLASRFMREFVAGFNIGAEEACGIASPLDYLHEGVCPMLLIHGVNDTLVPFDQSRVFQEAAARLGIPVHLLPIAKRGHGFDYLHHGLRQETFLEILHFLDSHLMRRPAEYPHAPS